MSNIIGRIFYISSTVVVLPGHTETSNKRRQTPIMPGSFRSSATSPELKQHLPPPTSSHGRHGTKEAAKTRRETSSASSNPSARSLEDDESQSQNVSVHTDLADERQIHKHSNRSDSTDTTLMATAKRGTEDPDLARKRSQFFGQVFAYREPHSTIREKIHEYSVITAEVKTNIIVCRPAPPFEIITFALHC